MKFKKMIVALAVALLVVAAAAMSAACSKKTVQSIEVSAKPKTQYYLDEQLNLTGGILTVNYSNGDREAVDIAKADGNPAEGIVIGGFDSSTSGNKTVTVGYLKHQASYDITVLEYTDPSLPILALISSLPVIDWLGENDFSSEEIAAAAQAFTLYDALSSSEKARVEQHKNTIIRAALGVEYIVAYTLPQQALATYRAGCTDTRAREVRAALAGAPATSFFDKYNAYSSVTLYNDGNTAVTVANLKSKCVSMLTEMNTAEKVLSNAIALYAGYFDLPKDELPRGAAYLEYPGITDAFNALSQMNNATIQQTLPLLLSWQEHYKEIMYEYCYYSNDCGFEDIEVLFEKLPLEIFDRFMTVADVVIWAFGEMQNNGEYIVFYAATDRLVDIVVELYETYDGYFDAIIAIYEEYEADGMSFIFIADEYSSWAQVNLYVFINEMMGNQAFITYLKSFLAIVAESVFNDKYAPGNPSFNADFSRLLEDFKALTLYEKFYFYNIEEDHYFNFLTDYYDGLLNAEEYDLFLLLLQAEFDYMDYQFGYKDESDFLVKMERVMLLYPQLANTGVFDSYFESDYTYYESEYQLIISVPVEIRRLLPLVEEVYFGNRCITELGEYSYFLVYYPQLASAVDAILNSGDAELIAAYNQYKYLGDSLRLTVGVFKSTYTGIMNKIQKYPNSEEFFEEYLKICAKLFSVYSHVEFDLDRADYEGDFDEEMEALLVMYYGLSLQERAVVITLSDFMLKVVLDEYYSFLSEAETEVYGDLLMACYNYATYLDPNGRFSSQTREDALEYFIFKMAECVEKYDVLQDKQAFDGCLLNDYLAFKSIYESLLPPDILGEWTFSMSGLEIILTVSGNGTAEVSIADYGTDSYTYVYEGEGVFKFTFVSGDNMIGAIAQVTLVGEQLRWFSNNEAYLFTKV